MDLIITFMKYKIWDKTGHIAKCACGIEICGEIEIDTLRVKYNLKYEVSPQILPCEFIRCVCGKIRYV